MARRKILMLRSPRQRASRSTHNHAPPAASAADAGNELLTGHRRHHQFQGLDHLAIVSSLVLREDIEDRFRRQAASVGAGLEAGAAHVAGAEDAPGQADGVALEVLRISFAVQPLVQDRTSTRLTSSAYCAPRMPSYA